MDAIIPFLESTSGSGISEIEIKFDSFTADANQNYSSTFTFRNPHKYFLITSYYEVQSEYVNKTTWVSTAVFVLSSDNSSFSSLYDFIIGNYISDTSVKIAYRFSNLAHEIMTYAYGL